MKKIFIAHLSLLLVVFTTLLSSCINEDTYDNSKTGNFEALWKLMDEHYCFFDYKEDELGVDWDEVHTRYSQMVNEKMSNTQLFEVMCNMLSELKDGHVNIGASFDLGRNWSYYQDYPLNYNDSITNLYLGFDYYYASGLKYVIFDDNVAYVRCASFESSFGDGNLSNMINILGICRGMILDLRSNGGGQLTNAHRLAARFIDEKTLIGYVSHKTGTGHSDFSDLEAEYLEPYDGLRWNKPVVVLTNR
nr:peptidase S41 [Bacteroidaceae bacterium]